MSVALLLLAGCSHRAPPNAHSPASTPAAVHLLGTAEIPAGTLVDGVEFGGISGLDRALDGGFWALSDDRGGDKGAPRLYRLSIDYGSTGVVSVKIHRQITLLRPDDSPFPVTAKTVDPEAIRTAPGGDLYWSSEGIWSDDASARFQPFLRQMAQDGRFVREWAVPPMYHYGDNKTFGARSNKVLESLAVAPDGTVFIANEDALIQDGPISSLEAGSVVRVTAMDPATGRPKAQYAYRLPAIPVAAAPGSILPADNGLSDLLALSDTEFIAVERAFAMGVGNTIRLVRTGITPSTTDVLGLPFLTKSGYMPMTRQVLVEMPLSWMGVKVDNIEGISWGKTLANGHRTLVLVADNNFRGSTQFIVLEVLES